MATNLSAKSNRVILIDQIFFHIVAFIPNTGCLRPTSKNDHSQLFSDQVIYHNGFCLLGILLDDISENQDAMQKFQLQCEKRVYWRTPMFYSVLTERMKKGEKLFCIRERRRGRCKLE